ncbi:MAG: hypothetical protein ABIE70_06195 [bacterium]
MKVFIILAVMVGIAANVAGANLALVEFDTDSYEATLAKLREIESRGITPRHIFAPNHAIVDMHGLPRDYHWINTKPRSDRARLAAGEA